MLEYLKSLRLNLLNIGLIELDDAWDYDNIISPFSRMYLITSGNASVYHNKKKFHLRAGHMYLIPSYTYSRYKCDFKHEQLYISFLEEVGNGMSVYSFNDFIYEQKASKLDVEIFFRLLEINPKRTLIEDNAEKHENYTSYLIHRKAQSSLNTYVETQGLLKMLLSRFVIKNNDSPKNRTKHNIDRTYIYILENLHKPLTVKALAAHSNLSIDYFSRSFYNKYKIRPNQFIQSKRIERAQLLLTTTTDSLKTISEKVGFENISYFLKVFKKATGKTPKNFRNEKVTI